MPLTSQMRTAPEAGSLAVTWIIATAPCLAFLSIQSPGPWFLCVIFLKTNNTLGCSTVWHSLVGKSLLSPDVYGVKPNSQERLTSFTTRPWRSAPSPLTPLTFGASAPPNFSLLPSNEGCFRSLLFMQCFRAVHFIRSAHILAPQKNTFSTFNNLLQ